MRFLAGLSLAALALVAGGCLHDDDSTTVTVVETVTTGGTTAPSDEELREFAVYFLEDGKVRPVRRAVVAGLAVGRAALGELLEGPVPGDGAVETALADSGIQISSLEIQDGVARVQLGEALDDRARAQVVYTLTQFPTVRRVAIDDEPPRGRAAFEEQTPAILVESPLPGDTVEPGFEATGTANTFEATFQFELADASGRVISKDFVTATSGSGTRGTFRFTVPYEVDRPQGGALTVFEISAASGARTNEVRIPLRLE